MKRRKVLDAGIAGIISFSGCLTAGSDETETTTDTWTPTSTPTATPQENDEASTPHEEDEPADDSTPQEEDESPDNCPPPYIVSDTTYCAGERDQYGIRMQRSSSTMELPEDELTVELVNGSDEVLSANPKQYILYQVVDGEWRYILPRSQLADLITIDIAPGERRRWQINLDTADLGSLYPMSKPPRARDYQDFTLRLPPGTYAFGFPVTLSQQDVNRLYARTFKVLGDDLSLEPSAEVAETRDEGSTVVVRTQTSSDEEHRVSLVVDAIKNVPEYATTVSLFELYNPRYKRFANLHQQSLEVRLVKLLRDALAHADPLIDEIRVETTARKTPPVGLSYGKSRTVTYGGRAGDWS